jgi:hypothetical protein
MALGAAGATGVGDGIPYCAYAADANAQNAISATKKAGFFGM